MAPAQGGGPGAEDGKPLPPPQNDEDASMGSLDDDDDEDDDLEYLLGFAEPPTDGPLTKPGVAPSAAPKGGAAPSLLRHRFPSKAGGRPAWLDPLRLPGRAALACPLAGGAPCRFLLQVYAPDEAAGDRAFHRALLVFLSPRGDLVAQGAPGSARAFRCQLPRRNRYYGHEPAGPGDVAPPLLAGHELELALERDPWGVARREAAIAAEAAAGGPGLGAGADAGVEDEDGPEIFREMELVVEPEPEDDGGDVMEEAARQHKQQQEQQQQKQKQREQQGAAAAATMAVDQGNPAEEAAARAAGASPGAAAAAAAAGAAQPTTGGVGRAAVARLLADYERRAREEGGPPGDDELPPSLVDELERALGRERAQFAAFQARVARAPSQVLRYCFAEGASALWPSAARVPGPGDVPPCGRCGGPRRFEFQVMPQLLAYLGVDEDDPSAPDWGTIAVFSCAASCAPAPGQGGDGSAYAEEFCWVQPPASSA